jgi:hypothetical protein
VLTQLVEGKILKRVLRRQGEIEWGIDLKNTP